MLGGRKQKEGSRANPRERKRSDVWGPHKNKKKVAGDLSDWHVSVSPKIKKESRL